VPFGSFVTFASNRLSFTSVDPPSFGFGREKEMKELRHSQNLNFHSFPKLLRFSTKILPAMPAMGLRYFKSAWGGGRYVDFSEWHKSSQFASTPEYCWWLSSHVRACFGHHILCCSRSNTGTPLDEGNRNNNVSYAGREWAQNKAFNGT
jgi:hypothetical protein